MDQHESQRDLLQVYFRGVYYLELTTICEDVLMIPKTTYLRSLKRYNLLSPEDTLEYKNRKLTKTSFVFEYWRKLSAAKLEEKKR